MLNPKIVYRFSTGGRTTVLTDIEWNTNNSKKIQDLIIEFETFIFIYEKKWNLILFITLLSLRLNLPGSQIKKLIRNAKLILDGEFLKKNIDGWLISKRQSFFKRVCSGL